MIDLAVEQLAARLRTLPFLDLVGGVARVQKYMDGKTLKTIPAKPDPDSKKAYLSLAPHEERAGIAYFEVLSNVQSGAVSADRAYLFTAKIRLVTWLNTKRLAPSNVAPLAMSMVVSNVAGKYSDVYPLINIKAEPLQEVPRSPELFAKYSYNEAESQYLMLPFDYFAFDFQLSFGLAVGCAPTNVSIIKAVC